MKIDVVFTIDKNYIKYFCVALASLLENNNLIVNRIYLISDLIINSDLVKISNFIQNKYSKSIICLTIEDDALEKFRISNHISKATYFRLLLSEIIPERFGYYFLYGFRYCCCW